MLWDAKPALAERGEMHVDLVSQHEAAWLRFNTLSTSPASGPAVYLPRFGAHALYGLTPSWSLGLGVSASLPSTLALRVYDYQGITDGALCTTYHDVLLPLIAEFDLTDGSDWNWTFRGATGLALTHWQDLYMTQTSAAGAFDLPFTPASRWTPLWFAQMGAARTWRPHDHLGLSLGAYATVKQQGDVHLGVYLSGDGFFGLGF